MKIKVNTETIQELNPCSDRLDNWLNHYTEFNHDISKFLRLKKITHKDKLWVALRLIPLEMRLIFALDCASATYDANSSDPGISNISDTYINWYSTNAASGIFAKAAGAYAAVYTDTAYTLMSIGISCTAAAEQDEQIEALIYLIRGG